jgi:hypothetical protein
MQGVRRRGERRQATRISDASRYRSHVASDGNENSVNAMLFAPSDNGTQPQCWPLKRVISAIDNRASCSKLAS